jgi:hypothetical protein
LFPPAAIAQHHAYYSASFPPLHSRSSTLSQAFQPGAFGSCSPIWTTSIPQHLPQNLTESLANHAAYRNRSLSVRSKKGNSSVSEKQPSKHRFTMASLRGTQQPELSKKLYKIIKTENHVIGAHESAAREQVSVARQLSEWGEATEDETISEVSDKLGVLMAEIAEQEDLYAQALEDYRGVLKQIRNTESSVQPSRDHKAKVRDSI